jgi:hypothetical protein
VHKLTALRIERISLCCVARLHLVWTGLAVLVLGAAVVFAGAGSAATDLPVLYSAEIAHAVFSKHYGQVWNYIEPGYRSSVNRARWQHCLGELVAASHSVRVERIAVSGARDLHSTLPLLGKVALVDVSLQVLYKVAGNKALQAGVSNAYWVKSGHRWYAVWLPTQYSAYKAGKCSPSSLY